MYDKLVKRLRDAARLANKGSVITPHLCLEAADALEKLSLSLIEVISIAFPEIILDVVSKDSEPKPITNADRIRSMSDAELAKLFDSWIQDCDCNNVPCRKSCEENSVSGCINHWLDWLKQESEV